MNLHAMATKGLPSYKPQGTSLAIGATSTYLGGPSSFPAFLTVGGAPSLKVQRTNEGGAETVIKRNSNYAKFLTDDQMEEFYKIARKVLLEARAMSEGTLKATGQYGRGLSPSGQRRGGMGRLQGNRRGVSNLAIVNKQSGEFAKSWDVEITRQNDGLEITLINDAPYAQYLAMGTRTMKAHGPFTTAPAMFLSQLNSAWLQATRDAFHRAQALKAVVG